MSKIFKEKRNKGEIGLKNQEHFMGRYVEGRGDVENSMGESEKQGERERVSESENENE